MFIFKSFSQICLTQKSELCISYVKQQASSDRLAVGFSPFLPPVPCQWQTVRAWQLFISIWLPSICLFPRCPKHHLQERNTLWVIPLQMLLPQLLRPHGRTCLKKIPNSFLVSAAFQKHKMATKQELWWETKGFISIVLALTLCEDRAPRAGIGICRDYLDGSPLRRVWVFCCWCTISHCFAKSP